MKEFRKILSQASYGLLAVVLLLQVNNIFFQHTHQTTEGKYIAHAHPYSSDDQGKDHHHSEKELIYLDQIVSEFYLGYHQALLNGTLTLLFKTDKIKQNYTACSANTISARKGRAPPHLPQIKMGIPSLI